MANLGDMRTRISDELQIDATTYATEIDRGIFSAIKYYEDDEFWFNEATPVKFTMSATIAYTLSTLVPDISHVESMVLELSPGKIPLTRITFEEYQLLDFDENFTGEPCYWTIRNGLLYISPMPSSTFTSVIWFYNRNSMSASANAESVWMNEAEEMIRLRAEADILQNRIKDYDEAARKNGSLMVIEKKMYDKTVLRGSLNRVKPHL